MAYATTYSKGSTSAAGADQSQVAGPTLTYEQRQERRREINERKKITVCWRCNQMGHWAQECPLNDNPGGPADLLEEAKNPQQFPPPPIPPSHRAYMTTTTGANFSSWYVNSGCTDHMTNINTFFLVYTDISCEKRIVQGVEALHTAVYCLN